MAYIPSAYRTLTLETSLEEVMGLGEGYLVTEADDEWRARDLLAWLEKHHPDLLSLPVALISPDTTEDGGVFEVDLEGKPIPGARLYRIERRRPTVYPI
jgi:hypothetical protein